MQRCPCITRSAEAGIGSSVGLCISRSSPSKAKIRTKKNKQNKIGGDLLLLSGGNKVIGSILPASVLTAFRRGSLVSSSQHYVPPSNGKKMANGERNHREKIFRIANKQRKNRWLSSAGKSAYRSISWRKTCDLVC